MVVKNSNYTKRNILYKMQTFNIVLVSKNRNSLKKFFKFFNRNISINFNNIKKCFSKKKTKKIITILKSPHVNKKAQEQFELKNLRLQFKISTTQPLKLFIYIKK